MNVPKKKFADVVVEVLATVGYVGRFPVAPATLLSALVCVAAYAWPSPRWIEAVCLLSTAVGLLICPPAIRVLGSKDPRPFVMDELAGMTMTLTAIRPLGPVELAVAFLLFRFFDVAKPLGVRRLDRMKHPTSIVWDDLLAGLYSNLALRVLLVVLFKNPA